MVIENALVIPSRIEAAVFGGILCHETVYQSTYGG
jgi:hypothetical protein